ncbi:ABC transporter substrate-binding protein [Georgenia halophila]|uniref:ABC transporter substrate-binding protein n=1 Tax=Georgenia halophila TaxID=620889 RepID=A0ABP8KRY8_9MICO
MRTKTCVLALAASLALAACGGGGEEPGGDENANGGANAGGGEELAPITVGTLPVTAAVGLEIGIREGIFEEHGLDVSIEMGQGGAALLPAVVSGEMQFATSNPLSLMQAESQGLDIHVVSGYSHSFPEGEDINGTYAGAQTDIEEPTDLEGATVAVNTLNGLGDLTIRELVRQAGGDPDSLQFVELPFPEMPSALANGDVDAAWLPEPFISIAGDDVRLVEYQNQVVAPGLSTMLLFTSGAYAEQNPEIVEAFTTASAEALNFANENQDLQREVLPELLEMDPALADTVRLEGLSPEIDRDALQAVNEMAVDDGIYDEPLDLEEFLP